ncbi:hypothetical protein MMC18_009677 [Xylographa bjoerkii]|nr:hypothetical protein [Xylographa bjoerkii]
MPIPRLNRLPRPTPAQRDTPITPHAVRALQQRRAAVETSARGRRRGSGRQHRETPRGTLRDLSKILSKTTKPIVTTLQSVHNPGLSVALSKRVFSDDEDDRPGPTLSMPIDQLEEDDDSLRAPRARLSALSEEYSDIERSVEKPRRAFSEQPLSRLSRGSFGSILINDHTSDISEAGTTYDEYINGGAMLDQVEDGSEDDSPDEAVGLDANTEDLGRMAGHVSNDPFSPLTDVEVPSLLRGNEDTTFAFEIPENPDRNRHITNNNMNASTRTGNYSNPRINQDLELFLSRNKAVFARNRKPRITKMSRHRIPCPSVPKSMVNKLSTSLARSVVAQSTKIKKDTLSAILEASGWFWEQVGMDLGAYAKHARRKTIEETDVVILMKRHVAPKSGEGHVIHANIKVDSVF